MNAVAVMICMDSFYCIISPKQIPLRRYSEDINYGRTGPYESKSGRRF